MVTGLGVARVPTMAPASWPSELVLEGGPLPMSLLMPRSSQRPTEVSTLPVWAWLTAMPYACSAVQCGSFTSDVFVQRSRLDLQMDHNVCCKSEKLLQDNDFNPKRGGFC